MICLYPIYFQKKCKVYCPQKREQFFLSSEIWRVKCSHSSMLSIHSQPYLLQDRKQPLTLQQFVIVHLCRHRLEREAVRGVRVHHRREHVERQPRLHRHANLGDHLPRRRGHDRRPQNFVPPLLVHDLDQSFVRSVADRPINVSHLLHGHGNLALPVFLDRLGLGQSRGRHLRIRKGRTGDVRQHARIRQGKEDVPRRHGSLISGVVRELGPASAITGGVHAPQAGPEVVVHGDPAGGRVHVDPHVVQAHPEGDGNSADRYQEEVAGDGDFGPVGALAGGGVALSVFGDRRYGPLNDVDALLFEYRGESLRNDWLALGQQPPGDHRHLAPEPSEHLRQFAPDGPPPRHGNPRGQILDLEYFVVRQIFHVVVEAGDVVRRRPSGLGSRAYDDPLVGSHFRRRRRGCYGESIGGRESSGSDESVDAQLGHGRRTVVLLVDPLHILPHPPHNPLHIHGHISASVFVTDDHTVILRLPDDARRLRRGDERFGGDASRPRAISAQSRFFDYNRGEPERRSEFRGGQSRRSSSDHYQIVRFGFGRGGVFIFGVVGVRRHGRGGGAVTAREPFGGGGGG
mmetsp:Transcript_13115/g.38583  ORF Transcript_13115/g.38583 Transcript_13115/m.38583 type:complete len:572 (-) Transcript_13115:127-1842(-)